MEMLKESENIYWEFKVLEKTLYSSWFGDQVVFLFY